MTDMSERLKILLLNGQEDTQVAVNLMLEADMGPSQVKSIVHKVSTFLSDKGHFEYLATMNMILCTTSLQCVRQLGQLQGVTWIDLESRAPLESIMDRNDCD